MKKIRMPGTQKTQIWEEYYFSQHFSAAFHPTRSGSIGRGLTRKLCLENHGERLTF